MVADPDRTDIGYSICSNAGTIDVVLQAQPGGTAKHPKIEYALTEEDYLVYADYAELDAHKPDFSKSLQNGFIHHIGRYCMTYVKEGIDIYAIAIDNVNSKYELHFVIDDTAFSVDALTFTYPHTFTVEYDGGSQSFYDGRIRAKDEWVDISDPFWVGTAPQPNYETDESLIELCDITTESSALIRALKAAVANKK